ncbi:MAG: NUDIX domain-containing protein [Desulfobacterales bacterium]|jgi:ADP-ribose pyrophosphatase YjhB (NUDIX family)
MKTKRFCPYCSSHLVDHLWHGSVRRYCPQCKETLFDNPVPAVCALVTDDDGRLLLVRRAVDPKCGEWCLPGGYMELGETPEEAVLRELHEETGVAGKVKSILGFRSAPNRLYHTVLLAGYDVRYVSGTLIAGDDALAVGWFRASDMPDVAFLSHRQFIEDFFNRVGEGRQGFILSKTGL